MNASLEVISFDNVSKSYGDGAAPVLDGVSLAVHEREFLAIVGPSGSGKTTLLRLVNRLIDPSSGAVRVEGQDVQSVDAVTLRRRIGYVFQGVGLFPHMNVAENIAITPRLLGWDDARMSARVGKLLELVRLDPEKYRDRLPAQLSGGERQRVALARALMNAPKLILADEPTGNLDEHTGDAVIELLLGLCRETRTTLVLVTHNTAHAAKTGRQLFLRDGIFS
jgi:osmoprotectant transport system ATP-binding protein